MHGPLMICHHNVCSRPPKEMGGRQGVQIQPMAWQRDFRLWVSAGGNMGSLAKRAVRL
jgi:hypothetical protein